MSKFFHPTQATSIFAAYYGVRLSRTAIYILGTLEFVLAMAFLMGIQKRLSRALVMAMVATTALSPGRLYLHPYMDHILLFFAFWTMLAGCFALYSLRDYDVLWSLRSAPELPASPAERSKRLTLALLLLRISVAVAVGMWCVGKFINPTQTTRILSTFYSIRGLSFAAAYGIGILQALLVAIFLLGIVKRISYGLILISHSVGVMAPGLQYLHPYQGHVLLFLGAIPMWTVCFALYYLRDDDLLLVLSSKQTNSDRHTREKPVEASSSKYFATGAHKSTFITIAVSLAVVLFLAQVSVKNADLERQRGPAIIALVQQQFEPSPKLLAIRPTGDFVWIATVNAVDCKFQHPEIKNCWEVYFGANVEGPDPNGRKPGKIEANFIVDSDAMQLMGAGPADGMLTRKARSLDQGRASREAVRR